MGEQSRKLLIITSCKTLKAPWDVREDRIVYAWYQTTILNMIYFCYHFRRFALLFEGSRRSVNYRRCRCQGQNKHKGTFHPTLCFFFTRLDFKSASLVLNTMD